MAYIPAAALIILAAMLRMLGDLPGGAADLQVASGMIRTAGQLVTLAWLWCGVCWPLAGCCTDPGGSFWGYPGLECVAYVPAGVVIIVAAMLWMLAYLPGRCCWPAGGQGDGQDGREAGDAAGLRCGGGPG